MVVLHEVMLPEMTGSVKTAQKNQKQVSKKPR